MGKKLTNFFKGEIVSSVFYILFGLSLLLVTEQTVNIICKIVFGLVMVCAGIYHIWIYAREKENATILDLFTGVIVLVLGGFLFATPQIIIKLLPYLLGAFILVDNIWTLKGAWVLRKLRNVNWRVLLIGSLVFIAFGIVVIVYPFGKLKQTLLFAGAVMLADGISDIVFLILLRMGKKKDMAVTTENKEGAEREEPADNTESEKLLEEKTEKKRGKFFKKKKKSPETPPDYKVDEGEDEAALKDHVILNARWKSAKEDEAASPGREITQMESMKAEELAAKIAAGEPKAKAVPEEVETHPEEVLTNLPEENTSGEVLLAEPEHTEAAPEKESASEEEILEEWKD